MEGRDYLTEQFIQKGCFEYKEKPILLTSGEISPYLIDTAKLCPDGGKWETYGDDSKAMIQHCLEVMENNHDFKRTIEILAEQVSELLPAADPVAISGGQRKDWIFSGPVAKQLGLPHISLYKDGRAEIVLSNGDIKNPADYRIAYAVHVTDILTEGSSFYREPHGWLPILKANHTKIEDAVAIVTRHQGGEKALTQKKITPNTFISIDEAFLRDHSPQPEEAIAYSKDPKTWSEQYLRQHGTIALIGHFDPNNNNLNRALKFLHRYQNVLEENRGRRLEQLEEAVIINYSYNLHEFKEKGKIKK